MVAADVQKTVDAKFTSALTAEVNKIGQTRFVRFKNEVFTAAFVDHARALDAVKVELIKVSLTERNVPKRLVPPMSLHLFRSATTSSPSA